MSTLREQRKQQRRQNQRRKIWYWAIIIVAALIVAGCLGYLVHYRWELRQKEDFYEDLRPTEEQEPTEEVVIEETETEEMEPEVIYCEPVYDFDELHGQNEDIYAWITVPETQVDYPVLQSETDNYYLDYNLNHSKGYPGCIYTNKCNKKDFSDFITVLYGHNMKNGTMFGSIHKFEDEDFFNEHDQIFVYTEDRRLTYQVYAAVKFTDVYIPAYYDVTTEEGRDSFVSALIENSNNAVSHVREGMEILPEDKLITLSTCVSGERPKRYVVVGKLIEESYYRKGE